MAFELSHTEIWQHEVSGERWLVRVAADGTLVESNGPLHYSDIDYCINEAGGDFDGTDEDNEWLLAAPMKVVYP